jgi:flagellar motor switch protein FliN
MSEETRVQEAMQYVQLWADVTSQAMGEIAGSTFPCTVLPEVPPELPPAGDNDLWIAVACSGALRGEMSFRLCVSSALLLAQVFTSEPADAAAEFTPDHREAVLELFRQISGLAASAIKSACGEVQLRVEASPTPLTWPASLVFWLRLGPEASPIWLELHLSAALAAALPRPAATNPAPPETAGPDPARKTEPATGAQQKSVGLDLLLDVKLAVTLRFGSRRMLLREVLDLNPGSIVGLDRQVNEPADMLLDGRVIARGEIVVIDGNYGFRVTEVGPAA